MSGRYKQPVQYGRESAHKSRAAWAVLSLGVCMRERQHIYEDLNESSSASPGGSQQLEIPPSLNSKRAANFFQSPWFFTRLGDFNARHDSIVGLFFCKAPTFCKSACFLWKRQYFPSPPDFMKSANIFQIRLIFWKAPIFLQSAWFSEKCQYSSNPPDFSKSARNLWIRLIFVAANICVYFQYLFFCILIKYAPIFYWRNCLTLGLRLIL